MTTITLPLPVFGFVLVTRAALAAGLALLFGNRIPPERRRPIGLALVAIGAASTVPAVRWISGSVEHDRRPRAVGRDERLIGATRHPRKGDDLY